MGGLGSGRPSGSGRDTVEACHSLDVNRLHREGCLHPGWADGWEWRRGGERRLRGSCQAPGMHPGGPCSGQLFPERLGNGSGYRKANYACDFDPRDT